ncbi:MAG: PCMD domain-containing protein [Muribaculaceae bacterium]
MKIYKHSLLGLVLMVLLAVSAAGCLKNDIPYPIIQAAFLSIQAEHQDGTAVIDAKNQIVTLRLSEQANLQQVKITDYTITEGATISNDITGGLNLTGEPYSVVLSLYQDYTWVIKAEQNIERYFTLSGQVGSSIIDVPAKRVVAYMPKSANLAQVQVTSVKLGPAEVSTMTPDLEGTVTDFSSPVKVKVKYYNSVEEWTIYVERSEQDVALSQADAWTRVLWLYGNAEEGKVNGFEYREQGAGSWITVPQSNIIHKGGSFSTCVTGLKPGTGYECRAISGDLVSGVTQVTTDVEYSIPNINFDQWWLNGKVYCPWEEGGEAYWDTGNKGATTLGSSNSVPSTESWNGKGYCAELNTKFVGIGVVGKLAAGNLFTGDYVRTDGTNGILHFGRPFTGRPTKLRGHWKCNVVNISHSSSEFTQLKGQPDTCVVYIALADWDEQYEIRTNPNNRQLFDRNDEHVIAYGTVETAKSITEWQDFEVTLDYRATNRKPKYILIVASASKYGDYFTGGDGTTLWVDDFSLEWDY